MERLTEYFETNFKLAYKSVTFHFKQFIWFYISIFIVQTLLGIVTVSADINSKNMREDITDKYTSHYVFYYMNTSQKYYLKGAAKYYFKENHFFDIKEIKEYGDESDSDYKCDIYIEFAVDPEEGLRRFNRKYMPNLETYGEVYCAPTPLFDLEKNIAENTALYNLYAIIIGACSFVLLAVLYNIRANNYRFDYGIYMAFGADKKKLLNTSVWELAVISLLTFVPSAVLSLIINYIVANYKGVKFYFSLLPSIKAFIISMLVLGLAVFFVIIKTAIKTPISLITAKDNSNLVHSPRVSVDILRNKTLNRLNSLSMLRYVKYYSGIILWGVLFSALFVCGTYCSQMYKQKNETPEAQFEITFNGKQPYTQTDRNAFLEFDGITGTYKEQYTHLMGLDEHILVKKSNAKVTANRVVYDDEYLAMDNVLYHAADSEVLEHIEKNSNHTGDLNSIYTQPNTIIISDSFNNTTHFDFKPGDKIKIADFYTKMSEPDMFLTGKDLLKERLRCYFFLYKEYTVGAVIHDDRSNETIKIYMNHDMYEEKTGKKAEYRTVYLYTDINLDHNKTERLYKNLLKINELTYRDEKNSNEVFTKNLYTNTYKAAEKSTGFAEKLTFISCFILVLSSIIWFFSQTFFYGKRKNEYTVLRSIGLTLKEIKSSFLKEALLISTLGTTVYALLSYLMCFGIYKLLNSWLFYFEFRYSFDIPVLPFITGGVITFVFAFISTLIPYFLYRKNTKNTIPEV